MLSLMQMVVPNLLIRRAATFTLSPKAVAQPPEDPTLPINDVGAISPILMLICGRPSAPSHRDVPMRRALHGGGAGA
jgi:hypothetical protein